MKFSRNQIIIAALFIVIVLGIGIYFFTRSSPATTSSTPATNPVQVPISTPREPLAKVEPPSVVNFPSYAVATFKDGRQMLSVPRELTTQEPFSSAINRNRLGLANLNSKVYFTFNPKINAVEFVNGNFNNFSILNIKDAEYWFFSLTNLDGTESLFYSLPDFAKQTKITEFPAFRIVSVESLDTTIKITVNTAQRGEMLEIYNLDFSSASVIPNPENTLLPLTQPVVTLQK